VAIEVASLAGPEAAAFVDELAALRIRIFRDFPYLYDGTAEYERRYLESYFRAPRAICVIVRAEGRIVGAATGLPLIDEDRSFAQPFSRAAMPVASIFYFGESILLPEFRGQGIGHRFFDERERWARALPGIRYTTFCAVERAPGHPRRPANYVPHDVFWRRRGYMKRPDLQTTFNWKDVDESEESPKSMVYWLRDWEA
jgi:GNAT superfamily N-acetyltransferase